MNYTGGRDTDILLENTSRLDDCQFSGHWALIVLLAGHPTPLYLTHRIRLLVLARVVALLPALLPVVAVLLVPELHLLVERVLSEEKCKLGFNEITCRLGRSVWQTVELLVYLFMIYVNDKNSFDWSSMAFHQTAGIVVTRYKKIFSIYSTWETFSIRYLPWKSVLRSCWEGGSYYTILLGNAHITGCDVLPELLDSFKWPKGENLPRDRLYTIRTWERLTIKPW